MLFSVIAVAQAAVILGWPCQRLNWAWRNVWTTCGIQALVPSTATAGSIPAGYATSVVLPPAGQTGFQLDNNGVFSPGIAAAPYMCTIAPNSGGSLMRNRCRRMLDTYGNLVYLCKTPSKSGVVGTGPNQLSGVVAATPGVAMQPHADNAVQLAFFAQACLTPGTSFPVPQNTCPGLMGWFTVVWNACSFSLAPGWNSPNTQQYTPLTTPQGGLTLTTPSWLCGGSTTPTAAAAQPSIGTPNGPPAIWNVKGAPFKSTKCRRALDQFGRTSMRCAVGPQTVGYYDVLRGLASTLGGIAPFCGI